MCIIVRITNSSCGGPLPLLFRATLMRSYSHQKLRKRIPII